MQNKPLAYILRGEFRNMPYVILGPPGTRKTATLVETILQIFRLVPGARLLVGTPSTSSADVITTRLIENGVLKMGELIRLVSHKEIKKGLIPEHLMPYCATGNKSWDTGLRYRSQDDIIVTESGLKVKCQMKYLRRQRITIGTCDTLGNLLQMRFPPNRFTHMLIDDAGQCTEPEIMVAVAQVSNERGQVILVGNPNRQAAIINEYARQRGLSTSFLERILSFAPYLQNFDHFPFACDCFNSRLVLRLLNDYRSLPAILNVYDELSIPTITENSKEAEMRK
ncbi:probable RNA helicase armi [Glossina fuscipes]|uniref:Probable RNA helicase armi n=1 Tax=Glossina fuscipes TaxID=7396 RepID=A0A8U0W647_9MUSC|nr:probable RNA helicase armi [Glossina fuscipes]